MAVWAEQRRTSVPARWVLVALLLVGVLLLAEAARQFAMPADPTLRDVPLTLPLDRDAQLFTLSNHVQVWLFREPNGTIAAYSARSPWFLGPLVRFEPRTDQPYFIPSQVFSDGWTSFDRNGGAHTGVAPRGLDHFEVRQVSPENIVIPDASHVILGTCRSAVPAGEQHPLCSIPGEDVHGLAQPAQAR